MSGLDCFVKVIQDGNEIDLGIFKMLERQDTVLIGNKMHPGYFFDYYALSEELINRNLMDDVNDANEVCEYIEYHLNEGNTVSDKYLYENTGIVVSYTIKPGKEFNMTPSDDFRKTNKIQTLLSSEYKYENGNLYHNDVYISELLYKDNERHAMSQITAENENLIDTILRLDNKQGGTIHQYLPTHKPTYSDLVATHKNYLSIGEQFNTKEDLNRIADMFSLTIKWSKELSPYLNTVEDAPIMPWIKEESFFDKQRGPGNGPDQTVMTAAGINQIFAYTLQCRIGLKDEHISALQTLHAIGTSGLPIKNINPKTYDALNAIASTPIDTNRAGADSIYQQMLAASLNGNMLKYEQLAEDNYIVRRNQQSDAFVLTKLGEECIKTVAAIEHIAIKKHDEISQDLLVLKQIKQVFPRFRDPLPKELVINLVAPNGKDYFEQIKIRRIEDDLVIPDNSYSLCHIKGCPSDIAVSGNTENILHEFDFAINNTRIEPFYMQDLQKYKDCNRASDNKFYATPLEIKKDLTDFLSKMVERTKNRNKGMEL